jgi:lysophospholipase L1-like esterase
MQERATRNLLLFALSLTALGLLSGWWSPQPVQERPLPEHSATRAASKGKRWWERRHQAQLRDKKRASARVVFLGDSITDQWSKAGASVWRRHYAPQGALNLGIGGDSTQHVLWRLEHGALDGLDPEVVVLLIGTNNAWTHDAGQIAEGVLAVLQQVLRRLPRAQVLLLGIFPRGQERQDPMRAKTDAATALFAHADRHPRVTFLNLEAALTQPPGAASQALAPDHLHLTTEGYQRWADAMDPTLQKLLGAP